MNQNLTRRAERELWGHPVGLYILFMTEMWERFSYYGMRGILVLYLVSVTHGANPGLGWTHTHALALYGWYTMLVYVACIPGGIIADKLLGQKDTVLIGGILLTIGHSVLAIKAMWAFYLGLVLIVLGVGLLKANISTMVGGLYQKGDIRRDKGFSIFYMGINSGALMATLFVGWLGTTVGWHDGFGAAGIGMFIGLLIYTWGRRFLKKVGNRLTKEQQGKGASFGDLFKNLLKTRVPLIVTAVLVAFSLYWMIFQSISYGLLYIFISLVAGMMLMIFRDLDTKVMRDRYIVIIITFLMTIVFWGAYEQAGGLLTIYASEKTDRVIHWLNFTIPAPWFLTFNPIYIIIFAVPVAGFWARRKLKGHQASSLFKMAVGIIIMGLGFIFMAFASLQYQSAGASAMIWLILCYFFNTIGELSSSPVSLSFITKLSPVKYGSIMMGLYFAATGFGNKVAGMIGELSQGEPIRMEITASESELASYVKNLDKILEDGEGFSFGTVVYPQDGKFSAIDTTDGKSVLGLLSFDIAGREAEITHTLEEEGATKSNPYHAIFRFKRNPDVTESVTNGKINYIGEFVIDELQTQREFKTFIGIVAFTLVFGILIILFIKPINRLTHGLEDNEHELSEGELAEEQSVIE